MTKIFNCNKNKGLRPTLRSSLTKGETIFWKYIKSDALGYRFRRQHGIGNYIVDYYCSKLKLVVEIDGMTHDDEDVFKNDIIRQNYLESIGLKVVRYTSEQAIRHIRDTIDNLAWICNDRKEELNKVSPSFQEGERLPEQTRGSCHRLAQTSANSSFPTRVGIPPLGKRRITNIIYKYYEKLSLQTKNKKIYLS